MIVEIPIIGVCGMETECHPTMSNPRADSFAWWGAQLGPNVGYSSNRSNNIINVSNDSRDIYYMSDLLNLHRNICGGSCRPHPLLLDAGLLLLLILDLLEATA